MLVISQRTDTTAQMVDMLQTIGESVFTATRVEEAWRVLRNGAIGLLMLDVTANVLDSLQLFRILRTSQQTHDVPVIFLADDDYAPPALAPAGEESVRDGWFVLPGNEDELSVMITRRLQQLAYSRLQRTSEGSTRGEFPRRGSSSTLPIVPRTHKEAETISLPVVPHDLPIPLPESASVSGPSTGVTGIFSGRLGKINLPKILSMLEPMGLTGVLKLKDEKHRGEVYFVDGAVWHAKIDATEGPDALFLLFHITHGEFHFEECDPPATRTIKSSTMYYLLDGLRKFDQAKAVHRKLSERRAGTGPELPPKVDA